MSGHSHTKTILHKKQTTDAKRGKIFSKLSQQISIMTKEKGSDLDSNSPLRAIIEKAKELNMPKENIERAIKKGIGELSGKNLEEVFFEAYGPGGIALIIKGITNNKNRTLMEIKQILTQNNGKLVSEGSVQWLFERKIDPETGLLNWSAKEQIRLEEKDKQDCQKLFKVLGEIEEVSTLFSNLRS